VNAIEAEGLVKTFGSGEKAVKAVRGIDLVVPEGTVVGLLGPNGAGKTTTVRMLTTLLRPDAGRAVVAGHDVVAAPQAVRASIGLSGQFAAIDENLTGRENLWLFGRLYQLSSEQATKRAGELLEQFGLVDAGDRVAKTYSGGMRRRLDLAGSLITHPEVLFLDEPTTGLDPGSRLDMWDVIRDRTEEGSTILLTTQYLEEADALADRVVVIDRGRVLAEGTAAAIKARVGRKRVRFATPHRVEPALFDGLPVEGLSTQDGVTTLLTPRPEEILRRLFEAGTDVSELEVVGADLEEAFLEITREGRDEEEGPV
jgi:ABC-2 type transport system ATP-binding protein